MTSNLDRYLRKSSQLGEQIDLLQRKGERLAREPVAMPWQPRFDVYHHGDHLFIDIEIPGVPQQNLTVSSQPGKVLVQGEKPSLNALAEREPISTSREFGPFSFQFAVPPGYAVAGLEQRLEHGVLHLKIGIDALDQPRTSS